jgi:AcrR family transcriptional regulator
MPLPRFQRLDPDKRAQLLQVAATHFAQKGYEGASLKDILAAAGFGKSSYYYYFEDKEDLFAAVVEDFFERFAKETAPPELKSLTARTFWPAAEEWAARSVELVARHPGFIPIAQQLHLFWLSESPRLKALIAKADAETRAALEIGRQLGCVRDDLDLDLLVAIARAADRALDERFFHSWKHDLRKHGQVAFDTFKRLVEARRSR